MSQKPPYKHLARHHTSPSADLNTPSRPSASSSDTEWAAQDSLSPLPTKFAPLYDQRDALSPAFHTSIESAEIQSPDFRHRRSTSIPSRDIPQLVQEQQRNSTMAAAADPLEELPLQEAPSGKVRAFYQRNKGLAMVLLAQVFGTLMNVTTRLLEIEGNHGKGMHPFQILFVRMIITTTLSTFYMWYTKIPYFPLGMPEVRWLLVLRAIGGFFGVFGMYYSLLYLPLADATVITFLAPSISCFACAILIKEPYTRIEQLGALVSFLGVTLIARPTALFEHAPTNAKGAGRHPGHPAKGGAAVAHPGQQHNPRANVAAQNPHPATTNPSDIANKRVLAVMVALIGVLGQAMAFTTMRWIGKRAHPLLSVNYFCAMCTLVSGLAMLVIPGIPFLLPADVKEWTYLVFLGLCGFAMQFLLSAGLQHEKSSRATNMVYTQMLFALFFDKLVFGTNPSLLSLAGSSMILSSAIYVAIQKEAAKNREEEEKRRTEEARASGRVVEMAQQRYSAAFARDEERGLVAGMEPTADDDASSIGVPEANGHPQPPAKEGSVVD